ncbi:MAG: YgfZ/GcvT domain-containing protein [Planctomycetota bacterium]
MPPPPAILTALLAMTPADLLRDLLPNPPYQRADAPYRLLQLTGPDAGEFLHRLCTQDVLGLPAGRSRKAAFLDAKGKLLAVCAIGRVGDAFWVETPAEAADGLAALLERYHFTEKLAIAPLAAGPCAETVAFAAAGDGEGGGGDGTAALVDGAPVLTTRRRGLVFTRRFGAPAAGDASGAVGAAAFDAARAECVRLLVGDVRVGRETEPTTLALEADLDDAISTTKGCYTGQEIVARIHTYGHTNRKLCLLRLDPGPAIDAPQPLHEVEDQLAVGRVMRAAVAPGGGYRVGLGFLPKDFQATGSVVALADGSRATVLG